MSCARGRWRPKPFAGPSAIAPPRRATAWSAVAIRWINITPPSRKRKSSRKSKRPCNDPMVSRCDQIPRHRAWAAAKRRNQGDIRKAFSLHGTINATNHGKKQPFIPAHFSNKRLPTDGFSEIVPPLKVLLHAEKPFGFAYLTYWTIKVRGMESVTWT